MSVCRLVNKRESELNSVLCCDIIEALVGGCGGNGGVDMLEAEPTGASAEARTDAGTSVRSLHQPMLEDGIHGN